MLDIEKLKNQIAQFKTESNSVREIISPFLSDDLSTAKTIELSHLGKFLYKLDGKYNIKSLTESPDFIIKNEDKEIGVEIVGIYNRNVESEKFKYQLIKLSEQKFIEKHPDINFLANIYFKDEELKLQKHQLLEEAEKIANDVYNIYINQNLFQFSDIIEKIKMIRHSHLSFSYNPGGFLVNCLIPELVKKTISKKEEKFISYEQKNLDEIWLLIVVSHSSPESYEIFEEDEHLFKNYDSKFDKVYILEDFKARIYCLK